MENQQAWKEVRIKELNLCLTRINKAMAMLELVGKVIPIETYQSGLNAQMASYRGLRDLKEMTQTSLAKYQD